MAASSSTGCSLRPFSGRVATRTGVPSAKVTISGYDTQYGAGMITSSPASSVAISALKITCLPPEPTEMFSDLKTRPFSRANLSTTAFLSSGVPSAVV